VLSCGLYAHLAALASFPSFGSRKIDAAWADFCSFPYIKATTDQQNLHTVCISERKAAPSTLFSAENADFMRIYLLKRSFG
jgi:hypothetical protein